MKEGRRGRRDVRKRETRAKWGEEVKTGVIKR